MRKALIVSLVIMACLLAAGCVSPSASAAPASDPLQPLAFEKTGTTCTIGESSQITPPSNPTTGSPWSAAEGSGLKGISADYVAPTSSALGAGGQYVWLVTAEKPGSYIFKGIEQRSGAAEPLTICNVGITFVDAKASAASGMHR